MNEIPEIKINLRSYPQGHYRTPADYLKAMGVDPIPPGSATLTNVFTVFIPLNCPIPKNVEALMNADPAAYLTHIKWEDGATTHMYRPTPTFVAHFISLFEIPEDKAMDLRVRLAGNVRSGIQ